MVLVLLAGEFLFIRPKHIHASIAQPTKKAFTIVALPDTQFYAQDYPSIFTSQTQWIADHAAEQNIVFVTHLGDIVNHYNDMHQWQVASDAMSILDDKVPYGIAPGNHDFNRQGDGTQFAQYFPMSRIAASGVAPYMRKFESATKVDFGSFGTKNSYRLFNTDSKRYIALNLEFCPPDDVLTWADQVLSKYHDRTAILTTHSFLNYNDDREPEENSCSIYNAAGRNGGPEMWNRLIMKGRHTNIVLILNGHDIWTKTGAARRTDYVDGHPINQLMSDYQIFSMGGQGYLRLMTFVPDEHRIVVKTYSPYLNKYLTDPTNDFTLPM